MSKGLTTCVILGWLLGLSCAATARPKTEGKMAPRITLRVYDYAGLPAGLLSRALNQAGLILEDAGVVVGRVVCTNDEPPGGCNQAPDPLNVALRIVPKPVPGADYGTLGYASGQYITVNYSRVEEFADHSHVFLDRLLACVVAHELGHVLLGADSHSAAGIMTACLTEKELRLIRVMLIGFLPFQKERIRNYVLSQTRNLGAGSIALAQR
ncbi:MAG: hypothetical protein ABSF45_15955 [Terriglobia bacterium]|jgi:hypothetical protein